MFPRVRMNSDENKSLKGENYQDVFKKDYDFYFLIFYLGLNSLYTPELYTKNHVSPCTFNLISNTPILFNFITLVSLSLFNADMACPVSSDADVTCPVSILNFF